MDGWRFVELTEDEKHRYVARLYACDYIRSQKLVVTSGLYLDVQTTAGELRLHF